MGKPGEGIAGEKRETKQPWRGKDGTALWGKVQGDALPEMVLTAGKGRTTLEPPTEEGCRQLFDEAASSYSLRPV